MSKAKRDTSRIEPTKGPIAIALACDYAIDAKDNTLSVIRIVDRSTSRILATAPVGVDASAELDSVPGQARLTFVLLFRWFDDLTPQRVTIQPYSPSYESVGEEQAFTMIPSGKLRGGNIVFHTTFDYIESGVYWFIVRHKGREIARIPIDMTRMVELTREPESTGTTAQEQ